MNFENKSEHNLTEAKDKTNPMAKIHKEVYSQKPDPIHPFSPQMIAATGDQASIALAKAQKLHELGIVMAPGSQEGTIVTKQNPEQIASTIKETEKFGAATGVVQSVNYGDCWFDSSLSSLALSKNGDTLISQMISLKPDGSYEVVFPALPNVKINVTAKDIKHDGLENPGAWANVLEAAIIKEFPDQAQKGLNPEVALRLLTSKDTKSLILSGKSTDTEIRQTIEHNLQTQNPMVTYVNKDIKGLSGSDGPIFNNHAYSVIGFDPKNDTVILRNPFGLNHNLPIKNSNIPEVNQTINGITNLGDGELTMNINTYSKVFGILAYTTHLKDFNLGKKHRY